MIFCCKITEDQFVLQRAMSMCSKQRQMHINSIKPSKHKSQSISAGLLLKYCLLKSGYDDSSIKISESGKPYIEGDPVCFSLSHSGEYAVCTVADHPIGIDIQRISDMKERTTEKFCTDAEKEYLIKSKKRQTEAVKLWTLKESYLKASGCNTSEAFSAEFDISCSDTIKGPEGYKYEIITDIEGYIIAVCKSV